MTKDLTSGSPLKVILLFSLPLVLGNLFQQFYALADTIIVGRFCGVSALASVGATGSVNYLILGFVIGVCNGFAIPIAQLFGARDYSDLRRHVANAAWLCIAGSVVLTISTVALTRPMMQLMQTPDDIIDGAVIYIGWIFAGIPFIFLYNMVAAIMRALGDSKTPLYFLILTSALNIGLDLLFIVPFHFGVLGAGMGTALACALVSLAMGWCCCVRNAQLRLRRGEAHAFRPEILKKAFRIGAPVAVQEIAMNGAMVASTMILAPLGAAAIAANSFAVTAESLCYMPGYGVGSAATTLVGRSVGAGDAVQARRYGNICTALGGALMGCTGLLMMIFCPFVFRLLTPVAEVRTLAAQALRIGLLAEPLFGVSIAAAGALRGAGDTLVPSLLNLGSIWIVRLGLSLLLVGKLGLRGMWIAMAIELCVRGTLMLWRQKTSKFYETQSKLHGG